AGTPWELGLAETQQTLFQNGLRDRITVQVDGQLKTGRDVVVAALLGAEEFGFATAPLVVSGCVMMRVCHLDTCPVGVATQNPELRARFTGKAEHVITFFQFIAEQVGEHLAALGYRTLDEVIGRADLIDTVAAVDHWKAAGLDLAPLLHAVGTEGVSLRRTISQDHGLDRALDHELIAAARPALDDRTPVTASFAVRNVNRTLGTMLGHEVTRRHGPDGLPDGTIDVTLTGSAGQSLGAFLPRGVILRMVGDANDYVGKGLSGGQIVVRPAEQAEFFAADQVVAGNVVGYGATSGQLNLRGRVGERFCVRNSGAIAVVEGVGDHALEYMTGGTVLILGPTGRNLGAGMSGGTAYCLDLVPARVNAAALSSGDLILDRVEPGGATAGVLHELLTEHIALTGSSVAEQILQTPDWPARFTRITPRQYAGVLRIREEVRSRGEDPDGPHAWQLIPEDSHGSLPTLPHPPRPRATAQSAGSGADHGLERGAHRPGGRRAATPGRPLHGLRHPVLPPGLPARQPHPRVERPDPSGQLPRGDRAAARDQQLPRVHRPAVPCTLRDRLRPGHQPAGGDDQAGGGLHRRPCLRQRPGGAS